MTPISVALCTFNGAEFLERQLASIAAQTLRPAEVIACDDGSTDATIPILEAFAASSPFPLRLIRNPRNLGSTANFEQAIRNCQHELVALCDHDDVWRPDKLETLGRALLQDRSAGYAFSDAELIDREDRQLGHRLWDCNVVRPQLMLGFPREMQGAAVLKCNVATGATMMFRRELVERILPIPAAWVHDYWIAAVCSLTGRGGIAVPAPLTSYRLHSKQQIGVRSSIVARISALGQRAPAPSDEVEMFKALRQRVALYADAKGLRQIEEKIQHLKIRSAIRQEHLPTRVVSAFRELMRGGYLDYSNSWSTAFRDVWR